MSKHSALNRFGRSSNPAFTRGFQDNVGSLPLSERMTLDGAVNKTGILLSLCFGGAFIGTIIILPYLLIQQLKQPKEPKLQELPFGPFLAIGAIVYFLWLNNFVDAYFSQIVDIFTL